MAIDFTNALQTIDALFEQNPEEEKDKEEVAVVESEEVLNTNDEADADLLLNEIFGDINIEENEEKIVNIEKNTPIEFIPGTDIPKNKKEIKVEPFLNEDEKTNIEDEKSLRAQSPNTLGDKQISLLKINSNKTISKINQDIKEDSNDIQIQSNELDINMNEGLTSMITESTPETGIDYSDPVILQSFNKKLYNDFLESNEDVQNRLEEIQNSEEVINYKNNIYAELDKYVIKEQLPVAEFLYDEEGKKQIEELHKKEQISRKEYYNLLEKLNKQYNEFLGKKFQEDEVLSNITNRFNNQLVDIQTPLIQQANRFKIRAGEASEEILGAEDYDIANLGFGVNSKKLVSILSGAESQTLRGIENFLGYKPFELSNSARKGLKILSVDKFGLGAAMIQLDKDTKKLEAWEIEGPDGKKRFIIDGDNTEVIYNSQTGSIQPKYQIIDGEKTSMFTQRMGRHTKDMTLGEALALENKRIIKDFSVILAKQAQVLEQDMEEGNFTTEKFSDWWKNVKKGNWKEAARFIPKQLLEQIPYMASNLFTAGTYTILSEGGNIYQDIIIAEAAKELGIEEDEITGNDLINYVEKHGDLHWEKAMTAGGFIAAAERAGIGLMISKGKYMRNAFKEIMKKDFLQGMKQIGNSSIRIAQAGVGEGTTEGIQTGIEQSAKGVFDGQEYIEAMGSGTLMGIVMPLGGAFAASSASNLNSIAKTIVIADPDIRAGLTQTNNFFKKIEQAIDNQFQTGVINREQKIDALKDLSSTRNAALNIPKTFDTESRAEALDLLKERSILENQIEKQDEAFSVKDKKRIEEINERLNVLNEEQAVKQTEKEEANIKNREETIGMGVIPTTSKGKNIDTLAKEYKEDPGNANIENLLGQYQKIALKALGYDTQAGTIKREDAVSFVDKEFGKILDSWDPAQGSLSNWITSNIAPKKSDFYGKEQQLAEKGKSTSLSDERAQELQAEETQETQGKEFEKRKYPTDIAAIEKQTADVRPEILTNIKNSVKQFIASSVGKVKEIGGKGKKIITKLNPSALAKELKAQNTATRAAVVAAIGKGKQYKDFVTKVINDGYIETIPIAAMKKRFKTVKGFNIEKIGRETLGAGTGIYKLSGLNKQALIDFYTKDQSGRRSFIDLLSKGLTIEQFQEVKIDPEFMKDLDFKLKEAKSELTAEEFMNEVERIYDGRTKEFASLDKTESLKDKPKNAKEAAEKAIKEIITEDNIDNFKDKDVLDKAIEYFEGIDQEFKNILSGGIPVAPFIKAIKLGLKAIRLARDTGKTYLQSLKSGLQAFNKQITAKEATKKATKEISKDKSLSKIQIDTYNKLLRTPGKPTARKAAGVANEVVNDKTRPGMIKNLLTMAEKTGFNPIILSAMAGSGAIRTQLAGPTAEAKRLRQWLEKNNPKALKNKKAYWYKTIDSQGNFTGWVKASKNKKGGPAAPLDASGKPRTDLAPARNKLFYSTKSDPAFIKIYNAAKVLYMEKNEGKEPQSPKRVVPNTTNPNNVFSKENQERGKANVEIMDGIIEDLELGLSEGLISIELAAQVIENGYQSTRGFIKLAAPFIYRSDKFEYGKGDKYNKGVKYREEHNPPASTIGGMLMYAVKTGTYGNIKSWVHTNYTQTLLSKKYDELIELNNLESAMPEHTTMYKFAAADLLEGRYDGIRYAAAGIDLNSIKNMIKEDKPTMAEELVIPIKDKKDINLESIHYQNELIIESNGKPDANDRSKLKVSLPIQDQKASRVIKNSENFNVILNNNQRSFEQKQVLENSLDTQVDAQKVNKKKKGISVFDFDDTLAKTKEKVIVYAPAFEPGTSQEVSMELTPAEFAERAQELEDMGASFDFSQFENVKGAKKGPLADLALRRQGKFGSGDIFVLTARPQTSAQGIKTFLDGIGLNIPLENITGLEDGTSQAKADWVLQKTEKGYNDFYFADDAIQNVTAVKQILDQVDVKSKVQQAIADKTINLDKEFNKQIEEVTGKEAYKEYSPARAKLAGRAKDKGFFKWFGKQLTITPSAEDFMGLMYDIIGKGKQGNRHAQFISDNLIKPYNKAEQEILSAKVTVANDFAALKKAFPSLKTKRGKNPLMQEIGVGPYTKSNALRVYMWNKQGMEIPGLSNRDRVALVEAVEADSELNVFADEVILIQKESNYPPPGNNWTGGDITTDILQGLDKGFRNKLMTEFNENAAIIFSEKNMNKLEALYGAKWIEALKDSLRRMKSGSNRPVYQGGGARIVNEMLDWLNGSVGAVMFLNVKSGLLQLISNVNFINWGDNNIYQASKAFASKEYWPTVLKLMNSDYLVNRRDGLKINVNEAELADTAKKNGMKGAIAYLLDKGFVITRIMDSLAIATGGATFYINRRNALLNRVNPETGKKYTQAEAEAKAFDDFYAISEESQQSSNPSKISQQQASLAGRVLLAFQNVTMQYNRMTKKSIRDLYNRRKTPGMTQRESDLGNLSKIVYYTTVQNVIFNALQQALFVLLFDDETEEEEKDRAADIANGMLDSLLFGLGFGGAAISTVKNVSRVIMQETDKKSPDYEEAVWEVFNVSPVLDSKIRKLRTTAKTFSWNMEEIKKRGWSLDNPTYLAVSQLISAATNIPIDRVMRKMMNMRQAMDEETKTWQRVALILGWTGWSVGLPYWGLQSTIKQEEKAIEKAKVDYKNDIRKLKAQGYKKVMYRNLKDFNSDDIVELQSPAGTVVYYVKTKKKK